VPRLALDGLEEFLDEVQVALDAIHLRIDETYFRPSFVDWHAQSEAS
jgi:hypothetical protein